MSVYRYCRRMTMTTRNWPRYGINMRMPERLNYIINIIYNKNCRCSRCDSGGRTCGDLCIFYHYLPSRKTFPGTDSRRAFHFSTPPPTQHAYTTYRALALSCSYRSTLFCLLSLTLPYSFLRCLSLALHSTPSLRLRCYLYII